jgi:riboflavin kinase/FMN adenylyltransferase
LDIWNFTENKQGKLTIPEGYFGAASKGCAVALGYFDGVHAGHREILRVLKMMAQERRIPAVVHTFVSMPKSKTIHFQNRDNSHLTTVSEKCSLFAQLGVDQTVLFPFSDSISSMRAEDFLQLYIKDLMQANIVVAGEDYRFGRDQEGDMAFMSAWGERNGITVVAVPPVFYEERVISSTWIRDCIRRGDMKLAAELLGCPISFDGTVQEGKRLGRTLGFPTANLSIDDDKVMPAFGVYASVLVLDRQMFASITSVGFRPTVNTTDPSPLIETMVYDRNMDMYGKQIRVYLISFMRPEIRFPDIHSLKEQVDKDLTEVRQFHAEHSGDYSNLLSCVI